MVNRLKKLIKPDTRTYLLALFVFSGLILYYNLVLGIITFSIVLYMFFYGRSLEGVKKILLKEYFENITEDIDETIRHSITNHPLAICMIDSEGEIFWCNSKFFEIADNVEILNTKLAELINIRIPDLMDPDKPSIYKLKNKSYKVVASNIENEGIQSTMLYWFDVTSYENLKGMYNDERNCFAYIHVDNYEDLIDSSPTDKKSIIAAQVENSIRQWAIKNMIFLVKYDDDQYFAVLENKIFEKLEENKFPILDEIREIETDADFPVSLSIGVGLYGKNPLQLEEYTRAALDLALGRGGDQAVVKKINKIDYYGGRLQTVEKRNKGKSKIKAHAIKQLIDQSSKVIIMGHKKPDMDSFGAAIGISRIARNKGKEAYIVINDVNESLSNIYEMAKDSKNYNLISSNGALSIIDKETLLVIVDTQRPSFTECPELLVKTDRIVVIDHHRKMEENLDNATLNFMEVYASSTSELVTEILQHIGGKKEIDKFEASALLAGITVDTKSFSSRAGVRTFEAASWLRRNGADAASVNQFFQSDMEIYQIKSDAIIKARILKNGVAISKCEGIRANMHIITSQAADGLLNIKGVKAAFVVGLNDEGTCSISARSLGEINVQTIMEKMGGGGHLTMAGAQYKESIEETLVQIEGLVLETIK
ncbi:MAG: DHH family phosphoesterase [Eubacteriales bacterium]